jgi:hypothetical protein
MLAPGKAKADNKTAVSAFLVNFIMTSPKFEALNVRFCSNSVLASNFAINLLFTACDKQ